MSIRPKSKVNRSAVCLNLLIPALINLILLHLAFGIGNKRNKGGERGGGRVDDYTNIHFKEIVPLQLDC